MNLFVCFTPLNALLAEYIIKSKNIKDVEVIFLILDRNSQHEYYFKRLSLLAKKTTWLNCNRRFPLYVYLLRKMYKNSEYKSVYSACIDNIYLHYILSFIGYEDLYTYDDGSANINYNSRYYKGFDRHQWLYRIFGNKYNTKKVKSKIREHYTIFPGKKNIIENTSELNFDFSQSINRNKGIISKEQCVVLLGTVYSEATNSKNELINSLGRMLDKFNCDIYYMPHPRDDVAYFHDVSYCDKSRMAEENIFCLLESYHKVNVYGFNSTVQINISGHPNIYNYEICTKLLKYPEQNFDDINFKKEYI